MNRKHASVLLTIPFLLSPHSTIQAWPTLPTLDTKTAFIAGGLCGMAASYILLKGYYARQLNRLWEFQQTKMLSEVRLVQAATDLERDLYNDDWKKPQNVGLTIDPFDQYVYKAKKGSSLSCLSESMKKQKNTSAVSSTLIAHALMKTATDNSFMNAGCDGKSITCIYSQMSIAQL
jgi:hypothetical protein